MQVAELPEQLAGLLGGPDGGRVRGDAQDVGGSGADLHDEQWVQPLQTDRVDVEVVGGEQVVSLGLEEGGSLTAHPMSARGRPGVGGAQDAADGGRADPVPESAEFAMYALEAPSGVLGAESDDLVAKFVGYGWASW
ncbi:hypothetical protein ACFC09_21750 [Streptomyces sp. NPDC056161]|uniref:hypothetical protein n=1 Tax=Streptomyces sp. NPDC056161 TaxID=3345732 RepID=UPI0035D8172B